MPDSIDTLPPPPARNLYETDEHAWIAAQIAALKEQDYSRLDRASLIEYLTEMTIRDRRELKSRLTVLLLHLLKIRVQPERLTRSWISTILEQQSEIRSIIDGIPSLGRQADTIAISAFPDALRRAARETGVPASKFPTTLPWTVAEALSFDPPDPPVRQDRRR
jgi:hypothetical protein